LPIKLRLQEEKLKRLFLKIMGESGITPFETQIQLPNSQIGSSIINFSFLNSQKEKLLSDFNKKRPFHYVVIDNFLNKPCAENLLKEFEDTSEWSHYCHYNEEQKSANRSK
jgi:hypothetical protein